ncbi:SMR family transporter [Acidaminococcus sp. NSJ-142]|uniref:DMT family transporter n=1 Tax=Acidaminococcus hominis TaxID=2897706 RepID=UPI001E380757|nr:SMR family transporter [Acidaminococcus hominis]MCD2436606.1 SMR family transporter [Acidaminococcus hominis]
MNYKRVGRGVNAMWMIIVYVIFSVSGLLLLKMGATRAFSFMVSDGNLNVKLNYLLLLGTCLYLLSFVTSLIAMKSIDLSIFYPVSAGLGYILVCLLSYFVLKEAISTNQVIGMGLILIGVIFMNLRK